MDLIKLYTQITASDADEEKLMREISEKSLVSFDIAKKAMSKKSFCIYEKAGYFHDYRITNICFDKAGAKARVIPLTNLSLELKINDSYKIRLQYRAVTSFHFTNCCDYVHSRMAARWEELDTYMYDEFTAYDNIFTHEALLLTVF